MKLQLQIKMATISAALDAESSSQPKWLWYVSGFFNSLAIDVC